MRKLTDKEVLSRNNSVLEDILESIRLPESLYLIASKRHRHLCNWLDKSSSIAKYDPHIFPQGSFRIGTAINPIIKENEYDLDVACSLRKNYKREKFTQCNLKEVIGDALREYTNNNNISNPIIAKQRCWAINYYDDENKFHMDVLPCVPDSRKDFLWITDEEHPAYRSICQDWPDSNPEEYAQWFLGRASYHPNIKILTAQVDNLPPRSFHFYLSDIVMLLKRHRDVFCLDCPNTKPASIIFTSLAAEKNIVNGCLWKNLTNIILHIRQTAEDLNCDCPVIKNPVNCHENLARNWLLGNECDVFKSWAHALYRDFVFLLSHDENNGEFESIYEKLSCSMSNPLSLEFLSLGILTEVSATNTKDKSH